MTDKKTEIGTEVRQRLHASFEGVLSTQSQAMPGYPFGSVVPYCLDYTGQPVILISQIAQHTKNILINPKVSLITFEHGAEDIQAAARLTMLADVQHLHGEESDQAAARYYRYFPQARDYHTTHDFDFYRLNVVRLRYIGGFGRINWLEPDQVLQANAFNAVTEQGMLDHMNEDHIAAMRSYCDQVEIAHTGHTPQMVGLDQAGFDLLLGQRVIRFLFDQPATTPEAIRAALVAMVRRSA